MTSNITTNSSDSIMSELFKYINNFRQSNNLNIFTRDYLSEYILSSLFRLKKGPPSNNEIDAKFVSQGCVFLDKLIYPISSQINNEPSYQLYSSIIQQELNNNKNSPFFSNGIYSHLGLYVKNIDFNFYLLFIFSTKIASYDQVIGCNDGNVLIGTILKPDHYIEGAFVKDITGIKGCPFGPKNIRYNNDTKKFYIFLSNSICSTINNSKKLVKTVYQNNINNISYGATNALGRNVDFRGGNVAENQIVSFINEDKDQIFNGGVMDYMANLGFPNSNSVGSATKNKLDIKSNILSYNRDKNMDNNSGKFNCIILTPKKKNSTGLSTIIEDNNDLNKSFIKNTMSKFDGISPIATKTLSPGNFNNKKTTSDLINTINGVNISPMKKVDFSNIQNPFETKNKLMNDNNANNNMNKNSFNNSNINNFSFLNSNNNQNNNINNNSNINNNGFLPKTNNLFNSINKNSNSNNSLNNNQNNNNIINSSSNNNLGNIFNRNNQINNNNNLNNNQFNSNSNLYNQYYNNNNQNNTYSNQNNNINNYNKPIQNQLIKIENNITGYQIIPNNIKFKSLLDIQDIGNQNLYISPKLNLSTNQDFCINLYNINSSGTQACQTTSRPKSDLMNYISLIKKKYPISKNDIIKFINNNLQTIIEDFYGKKNVLTFDKLINLQKEKNNYDINTEYNILEKEGKNDINSSIKSDFGLDVV